MQKPTSDAERVGVRVVIVTLDHHLASAVERAQASLRPELPGLEITLHAAATWEQTPSGRQRCIDDIARADIIIVTMLFLDDHIRVVMPALAARRESCDALVCTMSAGEVIKLTKLGRLEMDGNDTGVIALLKRLRGTRKPGQSSGLQQVRMLRRLPKILRFVPGKAQDLRAYFLTLQYWLSGSTENVAGMVRLLVDRYASGPRQKLRGTLPANPPAQYPDVGLYHPRLTGRMTERVADLAALTPGSRPTVGLLLMRSYILAGNTAHYDGVIAAMEARGVRVLPAFATGLDSRPAIERFFMADGRATVDALVSLTGFSLVGGPAYNDQAAAAEILGKLDVPYIGAQAIEFQSLEDWTASDRGLLPVEATMMLAIPELDGATGPMLFGGRADPTTTQNSRDMHCHDERAAMLAARVARLIALRRKARAERRLAIVIFGFPPNAGSVGTAAFLSVYASLLNTLKALRDDGYTVDVPASADALRTRILEGNAARYGASANVVARIPADDHVRREPHLAEIEAQWGPAPGRQQSDGRAIQVLGELFGNVLVGVQPAFGYEGDPMRLLFEKSFAPTHAFSAFYRYIREDFGADAVLHFGTHGALEFMPGKQTALSAQCWPDRLIRDVPHFYLYAANNPSEGTIAKRRASATLVSYLTPPVAQAGLYRGLIDLKVSLERWRGLDRDGATDRAEIAEVIQAQAAAVDLAPAEPAWTAQDFAKIDTLWERVLDLEYTLIPHGLHTVGEGATAAEQTDFLAAMAEAAGLDGDRALLAGSLVAGKSSRVAATAAGLKADAITLAKVDDLAKAGALLARDSELPGLLHALDGRFVAPAPSGDIVRTPSILPTGRNIHAFDPFRMPSAFAVKDGAAQASRLLARHLDEGHALPETIAIVLWGTDNMKSEGGPIAQALALMGTRPRMDSYGRLCGAELVPLAELGRARIDVMVTLSGIFRDLLPLQTKMLAEAAYLCAAAEDEPADLNYVRKHALAYQAEHGCDLETAALRVFSNADSAYGSNVNHLIENGRWENEDELADVYTERKSFAYGRNGRPAKQKELLENILSRVELTYQNLESVELGVTSIDHYFDTLGGINRAIARNGADPVPVYIGDQTRGEGKVRTIGEQVALETRTRALNPKWFEGMLKHGYEGVRHIEAQVTNTMGWSATTGQVAPWVYQRLTETFVLDPDMRERLASLNPTASAKLANRLIEAHERSYWTPDDATLEALRNAGEELEDRMEGIGVEAAA